MNESLHYKFKVKYLLSIFLVTSVNKLNKGYTIVTNSIKKATIEARLCSAKNFNAS